MALISFFHLWERSAWACATCGVSQSFTPKMLLIGSGFVVLPFSFVGFIAWRLWKDTKAAARAKTIPPTALK